MGWAHIVQLICASKLKGSNVLRNPTFAHAINFLIAEYASSTRCFPHAKTAVRSEFPTSSCAHIFTIGKRHEYSS